VLIQITQISQISQISRSTDQPEATREAQRRQRPITQPKIPAAAHSRPKKICTHLSIYQIFPNNHVKRREGLAIID